MKKAGLLLLVAGWLGMQAQDFHPYAGATEDRKAAHQASVSGSQVEVYTTADSFEKVYGYYRALYPEQKWPTKAPSLPSGKEVRWAFFILDGAKDLMHSKYWMKIQRPYIGTVGESDGEFKDVRDVTAIQTIRKN